MSIRKASKAPFPYGEPGTDRVMYFAIDDELCIPEQIRTTAQLRGIIASGHTVYAAWPGHTRTDLFVIDDPELLWDALR